MAVKNLTEQSKKDLMAKFAKDAKDTGSAEVQVAVLSYKIAKLTEHFQKYKKDNTSKRGLMRLIGQRKRMLRYLEKTNPARAETVKKELGIRH